MFAIIHDIGELFYPVAKNDDASLVAESKVEFDVAMPENEVIDLWMLLQILLCEDNERFFVLSLIRFFLTMLYAAMLSPIEAETHSPIRMKPTKRPLTELIMKETSQALELLVVVSKPISMSKIERLVAYLEC